MDIYLVELHGMSKLLDEIRRAIRTGEKTRYRLSKEASIPQSQLSRLMTGEKGVSFDAYERLAEALGLEIIVRPKRARKKTKRKVDHGRRGI
jgi:hypothetical protein